MSENSQPKPANSALTRLVLVLLPLATMLVAFVWIASLDPLRSFNNGAPPVEALTVERTILDETGIGLQVRAGGSAPMVIAQVAVDDAFWSFTQDPVGPITRGEAVRVQIPYPWVLGEAHVVKLLSNTGTAFEHEIAVAVSTPKATKSQLQAQGFTLGHFPQSFELSTLGGWIASRSSGQQSLRYGRIEQLFAGGAVETLLGTLDIPPLPASSAGPPGTGKRIWPADMGARKTTPMPVKRPRVSRSTRCAPAWS